MSTVIGPSDGKAGFLGSIGARFMIDGEDAGGDFSLVEHPMSPHALAAPLHRHTREDEYSYVLEGRMGALLGEEVLEAGPGDLVFKPREQWHTFWNAGDEPGPDPRDHRPGRLRALLRGAGRHGRRAEGRPRGRGGAERALRPGNETGDACRACSIDSGCNWASRWGRRCRALKPAISGRWRRAG